MKLLRYLTTHQFRQKLRLTNIRILSQVFFFIAFATKAIQAHALRSWRNRLNSEIAAMERERAELREEVKRRQSTAWVDQILQEVGEVSDGVVSVIAVPSTPEPGRQPGSQ